MGFECTAKGNNFKIRAQEKKPSGKDSKFALSRFRGIRIPRSLLRSSWGLRSVIPRGLPRGRSINADIKGLSLKQGMGFYAVFYGRIENEDNHSSLSGYFGPSIQTLLWTPMIFLFFLMEFILGGINNWILFAIVFWAIALAFRQLFISYEQRSITDFLFGLFGDHGIRE